MPKITTRSPFRITHGDATQALTDAEGQLIWALMFRPGLNTDEMAEIIWGDGAHWPLTYTKCVHVKLWALRKKLEPFGWDISKGRRGVSWGWRAKRFLQLLEPGQNNDNV